MPPANTKKSGNLKLLLERSTTGIVTCSAGNDPTGIATYAIIGATFGYSLLWLLLLCFPLQLINLNLSAKMAQVTKRGFLGSVKHHLGNRYALVILVLLWLAVIGTLGASLSGVGEVFTLIIPGTDRRFMSLLTALLILLLITVGKYRQVKKFFVLLSLILFTYIAAGILAHPDWIEILTDSLVPQFSSHPLFWVAAVGLLGTTISPHMYFWQVAEEIEEHPTINKIAHQMRDLTLGSTFSIITAAFIIITSAATLHAHQIQINTATEAAEALIPLAGHFSSFLFSVGLIGAGFLAIPILASVLAYSTSEEWGWPEGLDLSPRDGHKFYSAFTLAILLGLLVSQTPIPPFKLLFWSQVLNGFGLPLVSISLLIMTNRETIMGRFRSTFVENLAGFLTLGLSLASIAMIFIDWL
jgi:Mn2+/Fe2+ NRAMP family transporter